MKKHYWGQEEDKYLAENYGKLSAKKIAENLDRSKKSVQNRASILALTKPTPRWIKSEKDMLLKIICSKDHPTRSSRAVRCMLSRLRKKLSLRNRNK